MADGLDVDKPLVRLHGTPRLRQANRHMREDLFEAQDRRPSARITHSEFLPPTQREIRTASRDEELIAAAQEMIRIALNDPACARPAAPALSMSAASLCELAHTRGMRAERLLIEIKRAWAELPAARRAALDHGSAALGRVITVCIEVYFGPARTLRREGSV